MRVPGPGLRWLNRLPKVIRKITAHLTGRARLKKSFRREPEF
jgi:hypothetical protein